jgi:DNA mismatch endonuclease (patch repair protein)
MRAVKSRDTGPELQLRRFLHRKGYRYNIHVSTLPGKPDLVFRSKRKVVFVNGCFWHGHKGCSRARIPKENSLFWTKKIDSNTKRDRENYATLRQLGWKTMIVWQCQLKDEYSNLTKVVEFLEE